MNVKTYESNEAFFQAFEEFVARISENGQNEIAARLRQGFSSLNGLTDDWAMLMDSIEQTVSKDRNKLSKEYLMELNSMLAVVRKAVHR